MIKNNQQIAKIQRKRIAATPREVYPKDIMTAQRQLIMNMNGRSSSKESRQRMKRRAWALKMKALSMTTRRIQRVKFRTIIRN